MRRIIFWTSISLDGFFSGPDGELDWHRVDDELHRHLNDELGSMGGFLEGRVTYELMEAFWPTADQDPAISAPMAEFAGIRRAMPKVVYSTTLEQAGENATIVRDVVPDEVAALKAQPGGDLVLGGAVLGESFAEHGLIDEYRLYVHPVAIGQGRPAFLRPVTDLRHVETRTFGNGVVLLRYDA
jgi:dihydrofolate reductase